jgi:5'-phosphate synthase pdxT subunit
MSKIVGVLALQGNVKEHADMLQGITKDVRIIKKASQIKGLDGLVIPGGESTTIFPLLKKYKIDKEIKKANLPIFGTCAGAVIMAKEILNMDQNTLNLMDFTVERNAYGRQVDSFETDLKIPKIGKKPLNGVFIRAPIIKSAGKDVEVLAKQNGDPVLVRDGKFLAATFHPELTDDTRVHEYFLNILENE